MRCYKRISVTDNDIRSKLFVLVRLITRFWAWTHFSQCIERVRIVSQVSVLSKQFQKTMVNTDPSLLVFASDARPDTISLFHHVPYKVYGVIPSASIFSLRYYFFFICFLSEWVGSLLFERNIDDSCLSRRLSVSIDKSLCSCSWIWTDKKSLPVEWNSHQREDARRHRHVGDEIADRAVEPTKRPMTATKQIKSINYRFRNLAASIHSHLLSMKVKLKMQLKRDMVKSAKLKLTCNSSRD